MSGECNECGRDGCVEDNHPAFTLPSPDGRCPDTAWWRRADGSLLFATSSSVQGSPDLDAIEADALCVLAACAWARQSSETPAGDSP